MGESIGSQEERLVPARHLGGSGERNDTEPLPWQPVVKVQQVSLRTPRPRIQGGSPQAML
jgi:hypothetical protein